MVDKLGGPAPGLLEDMAASLRHFDAITPSLALNNLHAEADGKSSIQQNGQEALDLRMHDDGNKTSCKRTCSTSTWLACAKLPTFPLRLRSCGSVHPGLRARQGISVRTLASLDVRQFHGGGAKFVVSTELASCS